MIVSNYRRRIVTTSNIIRSALSSYKEEFAISNIYKVPDAKSFPHYRKVWSSINHVLKSSGITAPSDVSLANVAMLYEKLGRPLDNTPILHVGGTNGKVTRLIIYVSVGLSSVKGKYFLEAGKVISSIRNANRSLC